MCFCVHIRYTACSEEECVFAWTYMGTCMHVRARAQSLSIHFVRQDLSLNLVHPLRLTGQELQGSLCLCILSTTTPAFYIGSRALNSGPHACMANTSLTESPPQLLQQVLLPELRWAYGGKQIFYISAVCHMEIGSVVGGWGEYIFDG